MKSISGRDVQIRDGELLRRERANRAYMMKLENDQLLRNFKMEAGRYAGRNHDPHALDGWEDMSCQLRGHFLGHWLSAAAMRYHATGDEEIKAKAGAIIDELVLCQEDNGGQWVCSIPEKYLIWIGKGKAVWAPQYTVHKLFMGLTDVYRWMNNEKALQVADKLADWFYDWSGKYTREEFDNILDVETGGMLEIWADLLEMTGKEKYKVLLERYYRARLFEPLLVGGDPLTNMHANTTIPEIMGCARAWEVTGNEKWLQIVKAYWKCAVTDRGCFVTGGQTQGEIWTPKQKLKARLGDKNQEHCTVYNMIRLADFLFRVTGDPTYAHYIEYNLHNGIMAQTYWEGLPFNGGRNTGLLTYFLPMKAGLTKDWAGETDTFFCCHGTMVQANAAWNRYICYRDESDVWLARYVNADINLGEGVSLTVREDTLNGTEMTSSENNVAQTVNATAAIYENKPDTRLWRITFHGTGETALTLHLCLPDWITGKARVMLEDTLLCETSDTSRTVEIDRIWEDGDVITVLLPIGLKFIPLPDDPSVGAFRYGPDVLAGLTAQERVLRVYGDPTTELSIDTERQWGEWLTFFKTENQDPAVSFTKLNKVGYEPYQIYFKIKNP